MMEGGWQVAGWWLCVKKVRNGPSCSIDRAKGWKLQEPATLRVVGCSVVIKIRVGRIIYTFNQGFQDCSCQVEEMDFLCSIQVLVDLRAIVVAICLRLRPFDEINMRILCLIGRPLG